MSHNSTSKVAVKRERKVVTLGGVINRLASSQSSLAEKQQATKILKFASEVNLHKTHQYLSSGGVAIRSTGDTGQL